MLANAGEGGRPKRGLLTLEGGGGGTPGLFALEGGGGGPPGLLPKGGGGGPPGLAVLGGGGGGPLAPLLSLPGFRFGPDVGPLAMPGGRRATIGP